MHRRQHWPCLGGRESRIHNLLVSQSTFIVSYLILFGQRYVEDSYDRCRLYTMCRINNSYISLMWKLLLLTRDHESCNCFYGFWVIVRCRRSLCLFALIHTSVLGSMHRSKQKNPLFPRARIGLECYTTFSSIFADSNFLSFWVRTVRGFAALENFSMNLW